MTKSHILAEIKRTAEESGGVPIGQGKFQNETGIKKWHWQKFWPRWSEALREAGFTPNQLRGAYDENELLDKYAKLTQALGKLPAQGDLIFKAHSDSEFANQQTYLNRFGSKVELVKKLTEFCRSHNEYEDVARLCAEYVSPKRKISNEEELGVSEGQIGFVYLIKSGRFYKIGKTNSAGRREYELAIQVPEKATTVHVIQTDDPSGIEAYWHNRFAAKRKNGEWFDLSPKDIAAFKRRKLFM